jgi:hypothetical protein
MKRCAVMVLALALLSGNVMATTLIGRSATVNKLLQVFGWANFGYNQTALSYNWVTDKYETPSGFVPTKTTSCDVTLALGLPGKVDVDVVAPLAMKEDTLTSKGLGDVMVYARYGLLQTSLLPVKAALILGANLPTSAKNAVPALGDRTTDIGVGVSVTTVSFFGFAAHARAAYWLNGKIPDTEKKIGKMVEYNVTLDYSITKMLTPELCVTGYSQAQTDSSGTSLVNTEVSQHMGNVLLIWKPIPMLVIRPKVAFPLTFVSKGGKPMANVYGGLDIWVTVP